MHSVRIDAWHQIIFVTPSQQGSPIREMDEPLFTRHRNIVEPMMIANDRKATPQALHTNAVIEL